MRILTALLLICGLVCAHGQGTLAFANLYLPEGVDAPITNAAGNRIVGPGPYVADLFWSGDTNAPVVNLEGLGLNQEFSSTLPGYFNPRGVYLPVPGGVTILAQVRAWDTTFGSTYAQARDNGGEFGYSNVVLVRLVAPPASPPYLRGLEGFQLQVIPEPSSVTFALLGTFMLVLGRVRRRQALARRGEAQAQPR